VVIPEINLNAVDAHWRIRISASKLDDAKVGDVIKVMNDGMIMYAKVDEINERTGLAYLDTDIDHEV
jgi:flagella basal body P-ring formation protein FlgA